jgi:hypothetical protein
MFPHIRSSGRSRAQRWNDATVAKPKEDTITRVMADRQQPVDA